MSWRGFDLGLWNPALIQEFLELWEALEILIVSRRLRP